LTIESALILDVEGREVDGDSDGQPRGNLVARLASGGVSSTAQSTAEVRARRVAAAIDALMADRSFQITRRALA
jgi:hypothetical protein